MSLFDVKSTSKDSGVPGEVKLTISEAARKALDEVMFFDKQTFFIADGSWSLYDFLIYMSYRTDGTTRRYNLYISTYSMTELSARILATLHANGIAMNVTLLMDYKAPMRYPEVDALLKSFAKVYYTQIHAKMMVIEHVDMAGGKISLCGSANWTKNKRVECGTISTDWNVSNKIIDFINSYANES